MKEDGRFVCCYPAASGMVFTVVGSLGIGVVFNLVCRHRSPSLPFPSWPPPLLFSLPPLAIILANGERERKKRAFGVGAPPFSCRISAPQLDLGSRWSSWDGEWGPQTVNWAATLQS